MTVFSKRVEYGLMALFHMDGEETGTLVSRRQIAAAYHIPLELAGKVLQDLKRAGLVESVRGTRGGYHLVRPLDEISLADVIKALDGPIVAVKCVESGDSHCRSGRRCNIRSFATRVGNELNSVYHRIPLKNEATPA